MIVPEMSIHRSGFARAEAVVDNGVGSNLDDGLSPATTFFLTCLMGIGLWNAGEIILVTIVKYRNLRTLYFWSILVSASGIIICSISQIINVWIVGKSNFVPAALGSLGWVPMVTGQSLVLYSRLHMLYIEARVLRLVLTMIIFDAITLHLSGIVLIMGSNSNSPGPFLFPYSVLEKLQVTAFFIQEAILSGLYLWSSRKFLRKHARGLKDSRNNNADAVKGTLHSLIIMNTIVILLDISILVLEYLGLYIFQLSGKNFVYSVKLKIELSVLDQLKDFVRRTRTFDLSRRARAESEERQHIERQWEAALRRAFGSFSRSMARSGSADPANAVGESAGHDHVMRSSRSAGRASTARGPPEFFNIEIPCTSAVQRLGSFPAGERDPKTRDSDGHSPLMTISKYGSEKTGDVQSGTYVP